MKEVGVVGPVSRARPLSFGGSSVVEMPAMGRGCWSEDLTPAQLAFSLRGAGGFPQLGPSSGRGLFEAASAGLRSASLPSWPAEGVPFLRPKAVWEERSDLLPWLRLLKASFE